MTLLLMLLTVAATGPADLEFRFIGNNGFEISDGETTVLVDFPYHSGAFGYMEFEPGQVTVRGNSLCLFTHRHADHFDPNSIAAIGCSVAGPAEVMEQVAEPIRLPGGPVWQFGEAELECLDTEHGEVEHCSYLIRWHGRSIFFTGDVEELSGLDRVEQPLDIIVLSSWFAPRVPEIRKRHPDAKLVVSHHRAGEERALRSGCIVPVQGRSYSW